MSAPAYLQSGVHDPRLKPVLLRSLTRDLESNGDIQLELVMEKIKIHGVLREGDLGKKEKEEWGEEVERFVERVVEMVGDETPQKRWVGACLIGVVVEEIGANRIVLSYSVWFEKLLHNIQDLSNTRFLHEASCAALSDLFTRLASFSQVKKDATTFAGRVVPPLLHLINENNEGALDLLCTLVKFYPSAVHRYYEKVESSLASKIMSVDCNIELLKKYASALALLPHTKNDGDYWSVLMQKILININTLLNDALQGLEEEGKGTEIMKLLVPAGKDPPGPLGSGTKNENGSLNFKATKRLNQFICPLISSLTYSCITMLTNPYPSQVTVPIKPLIALTHRVLTTDGSLVTKSVLPSTTLLYQELLCAELPALHLGFIDLLIAVVTGLRSQILPHAAGIVRILSEYFGRARLPAVRAKVYNALELLLNSMGVGMSLYLADLVVSNALNDLNEGQESNNTSTLCNNNEILPKISPKKRKRARGSSQKEEMDKEKEIIYEKRTVQISVKIAALKAIETLLSVGGGVKSENWRLEIDRLLINVATNAFNAQFINNKGRNLNFEESENLQVEFTLVAFKALLASLLSPCHVRPSYLSQGIQLFQKGKLETGTEIGKFCESALLALEVLIHPRDLPLTESNFPGFQNPGFQNPVEDEDMYCGWNNSSEDEQNKEEESKVGDKVKLTESMEVDLEGEKEQGNDNKGDDYLSNDKVILNYQKEHENDKGDNYLVSDKIKFSDNINDGNVGMESKEDLCESDSESLGSIPDIVEADPDSD